MYTVDMAARKLVSFGEGCAMSVAPDGATYCLTTPTELGPLGDGRQVYVSKLRVGKLPSAAARTIVDGLVFVRAPQWVPRR